MSHVVYAGSGAVGTITMGRAPANSYEIEFVRDLDKAISAAEDDTACKVVIVRSSVPKFFCGGADIKTFHANSAQQNMEMIAFAHDTLRRFSASDRLFIAEVGGHCLGGGYEIALACDLRFAAKGPFKIGLPEVTLGLLPGNGGTHRLPALVGMSKALELMVSGEMVDPEQALSLGMVDRLYSAEDLAGETAAFAEKLGEGATLAMSMIKRSVVDGYAPVQDAALARERMNIARLFSSRDSQEGFSAFIEKRAARFEGR